MKPSQFISRKFGLWLFAVVLLLGFGVVVARSGPLSPIQVTTLRVEAGSLSPAIFGIGTVEARRSYLIGPTAAGRVKAVHVDVGETVKAGQLLAEIDPVDLDERLRSTEAAYARRPVQSPLPKRNARMPWPDANCGTQCQTLP